MRLLLIRHGQTPSNVAGALDTAFPGAGLTDLGRRQAEAVPDALSHHTIAGVYASRLVRTQLTAAPLSAVVQRDVQVTEGFEEILAGEVEMRTDIDSFRRYMQVIFTWAGGDLSASLPQGESGHAFLERYRAAVEQVVRSHDENDTVAVFSHGAAIRSFVEAETRASSQRRTDHLDNTGMVELVGDPERGWTLGSWVGEPLGGTSLLGDRSRDVTGD